MRGGKGFLKHVLGRLRNPNHKDYNPNYKFTQKKIAKFKENLVSKYRNQANQVITKVNSYINTNLDMKLHSKEQWRTHNPNLKVSFFKEIDTPKKAYWYGFLCADGSITKGNDPNQIRYQISIELSTKDRKLIEKFCQDLGLDKAKIGDRTRTVNGKKFDMSYITFTCKPMFQDLVHHGLKIFKNTGNLSFKLADNKLSHAFLLGFYDGDGREGSTLIYSSNKKILNQIKQTYDLDNDVTLLDTPNNSISKSNTKNPINRTQNYYSLRLGSRLLNKMMESYPNSLSRKRKKFNERLNVHDDLKQKVKKRKIFLS